MKQTLFIPLTFTTSPTTTQNVYVPFKVENLHVKSFGYKAGTNGTTNYVALISDLVQNKPLCILNQDTTYSSNAVANIVHQFQNPTTIQGLFTFQLFNMDGTLGATSNAGAATDKVGLIIEFNGEHEMDGNGHL